MVVAHEAGPVGRPTRLSIPAIDVSERLHGVGLKSDGAMETPDFGDAGWYDLGPRPGAPGPAVLVAHVHGPAGDDVFARLHKLEPGDTVTVKRTDGRSTFVVEAVEQAAKDSLPYERIWNHTDAPVLRLITCGGKPDPVTRMYPDNTIVYARLAP
jgi:sortase (surface protein transpeptidase)